MKRFIGFCFIMFSLVSWANNNRGLFQSSNPHSIVGLWNLSLIDDGLEFNCDLGFNSSQNVKRGEVQYPWQYSYNRLG